MKTEKPGRITTADFTPPHQLRTAVLFMIFNRPDTTKQVFEAIRKAKPPRLYVAADGPRADKAGEGEKCEKTRQIAMQVDWDCEVKTLFRDKNLGCKYAVSGAIDWFFENEEEGIILEDDCLPSQSFFWFCEVLLEKYQNDLRVWHIAGYNHYPERIKKSSYFFTRMPSIWGWATWKDRWKSYNISIPEEQKMLRFLENQSMNRHWQKIFGRIELVDTWDFQWGHCVLVNNGLSVRPSVNLIRNIGFGDGATHTSGTDYHVIENHASEILIDEIRHPESYLVELNEDIEVFKRRFTPSLPRRLFLFVWNWHIKLKRMFQSEKLI